MDGDCITSFRERDHRSQTGIINAGIYLFDHRALDVATAVCSLERDLMPALAARGALRGTVAGGYFIDIGIPADLTRAQTELPARLLRRALFLGSDLVANFDRGRVGNRERFDLMPGALTTIRTASDAGWHVFVVTSQSEMANGLGDEPDFASLWAATTDAVRAEGGTIDDWRCRAPQPSPAETFRRDRGSCELGSEMLLDLLTRWQVDPARCLLIGGDLTAATAAGIPAHLFPGGDLAEFAVPLLADCERYPNP
jgi:D-glycero-D-manno-heptose 1,7-bisphosphate phosphatase